MKILRLLTSEDDVIPLLLGFIAVNGDLRLYSDYLARLCRSGSGGSKRLACRYMEYLATVKEPVTALERLAEDLGSQGSILREVTRALRLGLEPSDLSERIVERIVTRIRARAELADEVAKASLETLALLSTIMTLALLMGGMFLGSVAAVALGVVVITVVTIFASLLLPSIMSLAAPRAPLYVYAASISSILLSGVVCYTANQYAAITATALSVIPILFVRRWWRQVRSIARVALQVAESLQFGRLALTVTGEENDTLIYNIIVGSRKGLYSNLGILIIDMMRLLPQEGSVTAARLLRSFVEFASRYLDVAKTVLLRSLVYEALVAVLMPMLSLIVVRIASLLATSVSTVGATPLFFYNLDSSIQAVRLMLLPSIAYTLTTSKIGRGTPLLPLLHWLPTLAAAFLLSQP